MYKKVEREKDDYKITFLFRDGGRREMVIERYVCEREKD